MQNIYVEISFTILIFLIVLDQTFRRGDGKCLQGIMHDSKCDPEEEMNYSTDHVLHKTKSVTIIYIWISAVYVMTLLCHVHMDKYHIITLLETTDHQNSNMVTYKSFLSVLRKFSMMFTHA